jgi:predicted DNA-binding transcriptional regulator AlpA
MSKLLSTAQLMERFGVSRATIYLWRKQGRLPKPIKAWGTPRWSEEQIQKALQDDSAKIAVNSLS